MYRKYIIAMLIMVQSSSGNSIYSHHLQSAHSGKHIVLYYTRYRLLSAILCYIQPTYVPNIQKPIYYYIFRRSIIAGVSLRSVHQLSVYTASSRFHTLYIITETEAMSKHYLAI